MWADCASRGAAIAVVFSQAAGPVERSEVPLKSGTGAKCAPDCLCFSLAGKQQPWATLAIRCCGHGANQARSVLPDQHWMAAHPDRGPEVSPDTGPHTFLKRFARRVNYPLTMFAHSALANRGDRHVRSYPASHHPGPRSQSRADQASLPRDQRLRFPREAGSGGANASPSAAARACNAALRTPAVPS